MSQFSAARGVTRRFGVLAAIAVLAALAVHSSAARADGPGSGSPWVASVGDSYISGEAGRWAGNSNAGAGGIDALGSTAYYDNASGSGEAIAGCHRSRSAEVFIGSGVNGVNFACSGARTATSDGSDFKPGLDFYVNGSKEGQARALQSFAATHNVKMIALSIGGNNFNFASIVQSCVQDWLLSPSWWKDYCNDDSSVTANFTAANVAAQTAAIKGAILNVRQAMINAGYADAAYKILVQDYESPLPPGSGFRYGESGYTRQNTGGCGFWNNDANWANNSALPTINNAVRNAASQTGLSNVRLLELQSAFNGHRLCENTVGLLEEKGLTSWTQVGAVDKSEWVNQIRTVSTVFGPYYVQESFHPNYWGQLALRSCVRQAYNGGTPRGGTCTIAGSGLTSRGEPSMALN
jgi:hypothetical protein